GVEVAELAIRLRSDADIPGQRAAVPNRSDGGEFATRSGRNLANGNVARDVEPSHRLDQRGVVAHLVAGRTPHVRAASHRPQAPLIDRMIGECDPRGWNPKPLNGELVLDRRPGHDVIDMQ